MEISTEIGTLIARVGEKEAIRIYAEAGFTSLDYSFDPYMENGTSPYDQDDWESHAKDIRRYADSLGVRFNQAHGPFMFMLPANQRVDLHERVIPMTERCLEVCAILGVPHVVVHPIHNLRWHDYKDELWTLNQDFYHELAATSEKTGVKIALENMFYSDRRRGCISMDMLNEPHDYVRFYKELDDEKHFICLLDTGHCGLVGEDTADSIRVLGPLLKGLHVNDNCYHDDDHLMPYEGLIDWDRVLKALADVDYQGDFTFESLHLYEDRVPEELFPLQARHLFELGKAMVARLASFKKQ